MVRKGSSNRSRMQKKHARKAERRNSAHQGALGRWHSSSGGMNKWQELYDLIQRSNVIIEVVDARDVEGTRVLTAERWFDKGRLIIIANKSDLAGPGKALPKGVMCISAKTQDPEDRVRLMDAIMAKTTTRPAKALLIGYPNVGKSSIINLLAKRRAARVSPVAGTTKSEQWVNVSASLMITDYRGIFPESETKEALVRKGALNVQADAEKYAHGIAERILRSPLLRSWLLEKYGIQLEGARNSDDVLAAIARRRGWFLKGGELNISEAARMLIRAFREAPEI